MLLHLAVSDRLRYLEQPVGERALAVVDVRDDAEIPNAFHARELKGENTPEPDALVRGAVGKLRCNYLA